MILLDLKLRIISNEAVITPRCLSLIVAKPGHFANKYSDVSSSPGQYSQSGVAIWLLLHCKCARGYAHLKAGLAINQRCKIISWLKAFILLNYFESDCKKC